VLVGSGSLLLYGTRKEQYSGSVFGNHNRTSS